MRRLTLWGALLSLAMCSGASADVTRLGASGGVIPLEQCDSIAISRHYTLSYLGVEYDTVAGTSTWNYTLTWDGTPPDLSFFFIELCADIANANLIAAEPDFATVGKDGVTLLWGIKWDDIQRFPADTPITFSFTLDQMLAEDNGQFAPKAGINKNLSYVCGPSLICEEISDCQLILDCPSDTTVEVTVGEQVCIPGFFCNAYQCELSFGTLFGDTLCFTPDTAGTYQVLQIGSDTCGNVDTCVTIITVTRKGGPVINIGNNVDTLSAFCVDSQVCVPYSVSSPDGIGGLVVSLLYGPPGTFVDSALSRICFPVETSGTYCLAARVIDSLDRVGVDSICVIVGVNHAPQITVPPPPDPIVCLPGDSTVCIEGWYVFDSDGDSLVYNTMGSGTYDPQTGVFCSRIGAPGDYTQTLVVSDTCGATVSATLTLLVLGNDPPQVILEDTALSRCEPDTVCLPFTLSDDGATLPTLTSNLGEIRDGFICFYPDTSGVYTVILTAVDDCDASDTDTTHVTITINTPPAIELPGLEGQILALCDDDGPACLADPVWIYDPDSGDVIDIVLPPDVAFDPETGTLCLLEPVAGVLELELRATDTCGAEAVDTLRVEVQVGQPPTITFSVPDTTIYVCDPDTSLCFFVFADSPDDSVIIEEILNPGSFDAETGEFCFNPDSICFDHPETIDTTVCIVFRATNNCGSALDSLCVTIVSNLPPTVTLPPDETILLCDAGEVCLSGLVITDPEAADLEVLTNYGSALGSDLCFLADSAGVYEIVVCATDPCGTSACDTVTVVVEFNAPPQIAVGAVPPVLLCAPGEICIDMPQILDPDGDDVEITVTGAERQGDRICIQADSAGVYAVSVIAADSCGAADSATIEVEVRLNSAPRVLIRAAPPVELCDPDTVLCYPVNITDFNGTGDLTVRLIKTDLRFWSFDGSRLCLDAATGLAGRVSANFVAIVEAEDACGEKGRDTITVALSTNRPPVAALPADTSVFLCEPSILCLGPVEYSDPDGDPLEIQIAGGEAQDDSVCLTADRDTVLWITLIVTDSCGASATDSMRLEVTLNEPPVLQLPEVSQISVCAFDSVCIPGFSATDPEQGAVAIQLDSGPGVLDPATGTLCFVPESGGVYEFTIYAEDECTRVSNTWSVEVTTNLPPVVGDAPDAAYAACEPGDTLCLPFEATDPEGDLLTFSLESGPGQIDPISGILCFAPDTSGRYAFVVSVADSCGASRFDTGHAVVQFNRAPELSFSSSDTSLYVCNSDTVLCFTVTATDADGDTPAITELLNPGSFDPSTGVVCFNPDSVGFADPTTLDTTICLIFAATDSCGAEAVDTLCIEITRNRAPIVDLGPDTTAALCASGSFCIDIAGRISDADGDPLTIDVTPSASNDGDTLVCVPADTAGTYTVIICATDPCGLQACDTLRVEVTLNHPPTVQLPPDSTIIACSLDSVCLGPVVIDDPDLDDELTIVVTGGAELLDDQLCFSPSGDDQYTFVVTATDICGAQASDTITVSVDVNDPPVLIFSSSDTTIQACHLDTELCFSVIAEDPDGDVPEIEEVLVPGFYDPATGTFCFNPDSICFGNPLGAATAASPCFEDANGNFSICVVFRATDACGASTTDSLCITIERNQPPDIVFSVPDTALFLCNPDTNLCFDISAVDPEGDSVVISEILNPGAYYPEAGIFCFNPDSICFGNAKGAAAAAISEACAQFRAGEPLDICLVFAATDACGNVRIDSLCLSLTANLPPVVSAPDTVQHTICDPGDEVCVSPVFADDPEDGPLPLSIPGAVYDSLLQSFCFVADTTGIYTFTLTATDDCSVQTSRLVVVQVGLNQPPALLIPDDTALFLCDPDTLCFPVALTDPDGRANITDISGPAFYVPLAEELCVIVEDDQEPIVVIVTASDNCGATAIDTFTVTATINSPPSVALPQDFAARACGLGSFCVGPILLEDPDANLAGDLMIEGGVYDADSGRICIEVTGDGTYIVVATATDSCGAAATDSLVVDITVNAPPVTSFSIPDTSLFLCQPDTLLCFTFAGIDPDGDAVLLNETLNPGTFDALTGEFCFNPAEVCFNTPNEYDTTLCLIFSASDSCGATTIDTICIEVTANAPPMVTAAADTILTVCDGDSVCLNPFTVTDPNGLKDTLSISVTGPDHVLDTVAGQICFAPGPGTYRFIITATDRCGLSGEDTIDVQVGVNQPPVLDLPDDFAERVCVDSSLCFPVSVFDPDAGDSVRVQITSGAGVFDPGTGEICLPVDTSGLYRLIVSATDRCGATVLATVHVTATLNAPPVWTQVPDIDTSFCTAPAQFCLQVMASDPDGEPVRYQKVLGVGQIDSITGEICFAPGSATDTYRFYVAVFDSCGAMTMDTAQVIIRINRKPSVVPPRDTLLVLCEPEAICFPAVTGSDPDGDDLLFELLDGPGSLNDGVLCFTPDTPGVAIYCFTVRGVDPCGAADTAQFCAQVTLNRPPVLTVPEDFAPFVCASEEICFEGISAVDPDGGLLSIVKTGGPGTFDATQGQVCFTPASGGGTYTFIFTASDTCGAQDIDTVLVTVRQNRPPSLDVPPSATACVDSQVCIDVGATDPDLGGRLTITQVSGPPGVFSPSPLSGPAPLSGQWCWTPTSDGRFEVVFQVADSCGVAVLDTTYIDVAPFCDTLCFAASIPVICPDSTQPDAWLFQGRAIEFPVMVNLSRPIGGFEFLIGYDATALTVMEVFRGEDVTAWEFFTYRLVDPATTCTGICPSGLLRIVGIADINNGTPISDPTQTQPGGGAREFARIRFQVSNDRTLAGQFIPVQFWWNDCGDNTFSSPAGDLYVSSDIQPDTCLAESGKTIIEPCATFSDGGGCIPRAADIDDRGDLNLNGFPYEIADAVFYTNYFIIGPSIFDQDPIRQESQIAASDVNGDGVPLTVADLVFLIRIIVGLEEPINDGMLARLATTEQAMLTWSNDENEVQLELSSPLDIGAVALACQVMGDVRDVQLAREARIRGMELRWRQEADQLRILVYSMNAAAIEAGQAPLVRITGAERVTSITADISDAAGRSMPSAALAGSTRPDGFRLFPNSPNPFNPSTEIRFTLDRETRVHLSIINLLGRSVAVLVDDKLLPAGEHRYNWLASGADGAELPSGLYLYRLQAEGHSETRKMLLLR